MLFKCYSNVIQMLFKCYSNVIQMLKVFKRHYYNKFRNYIRKYKIKTYLLI